MFLMVSLGLFLVFFGNVFWASIGNPSLFTDVQELLLLIVSVLFFVVGILSAERQSQNKMDIEKE